MLEHARTQNAGHLAVTCVFDHVTFQSRLAAETMVAYPALVAIDALMSLEMATHP